MTAISIPVSRYYSIALLLLFLSTSYHVSPSPHTRYIAVYTCSGAFIASLGHPTPEVSLFTECRVDTSLRLSAGFQSDRAPSSQKRTLTSSSELVAFGQNHVTRGVSRLTEAVIEKGEGTYVTLLGGRKVLDFTCGIGVTNLGMQFISFWSESVSHFLRVSGHCHSKVSKAAADQCMVLVHGQVILICKFDGT